MQTELLTGFDVVWTVYPRKVGKKKAREVWTKLNPSAERVQKMLATLAWQVKQPAWVKDGGAYVPHFATWLNQERWDDEPFFTTERQPSMNGLALSEDDRDHVARIQAQKEEQRTINLRELADEYYKTHPWVKR